MELKTVRFQVPFPCIWFENFRKGTWFQVPLKWGELELPLPWGVLSLNPQGFNIYFLKKEK